MAIEFNADSSNVYWVGAKYNVSVSFWIYMDSIPSTEKSICSDNSGFDGRFISVQNSGARTNSIVFHIGTPGAYYVYKADNAIISGAWCHIVHETTTPAIYLNGVSKTITVESGLPSVSPIFLFRIGYTDLFNSFYGRIQDIRGYNRILSASEIAELYNSRCQRVVMDGLVFWAPMDGAAGLSSFDGATLSSANTIIDRISGVQGVPSGSPIGRGNTIQRIY